MRFKLRLLFFIATFVTIAINCNAQARLVLNGAYINITDSAFLVVDNPATDAITRTSGHIISEGEFNRVKWNIGTTTGTYIVPWGFSNTNFIPLTYTKDAGTGTGSFIFSTYRTPTWQNSLYLPTGVLNMHAKSGAADNSAMVIDRFWQIDANGYTTKPDLTNLIFTYIGTEWSEASNTITESNLKAQRWNSTSNLWGDWGPFGIDASGTSTVTVGGVNAIDFFKWWTLTDSLSPLPIELLSFDGKCANGKIALKWSTASEINNDFFTLEKSSDAIHWKNIATIAGAGSSTHEINYAAGDDAPLDGINYYLLKQTDYDGKFSYSSIVPVAGCDIDNFNAILFPNPSDGYVNILIHSDDEHSSLLRIYNSIGQIVYYESIPPKRDNILHVTTCNLIDGLYNVSLESDANSFQTKFVVEH